MKDKICKSQRSYIKNLRMCIWKVIKWLELDSHTIKIYASWRNALLVDFNLTLLITMNMSSACSFIFMQIQTIFIRMVSHLHSLWNRGIRELRNGLLSTNLVNDLLLAFFSAEMLYNNFHQRQKAINNMWNFTLRQ